MGRGGCRFAHVVRQPRCPGGASPAQANGLCDCGCGCRNLAGERRAGQRWRVHRRTREGCAQLWSAKALLAAAAMSAADAVMARVMRWPRPGGDLGQAVGDGHGPGRRGRWSCRNSERLGLRRPAGSAVRAGGQADIGDRAARAQEWCVHLPDGTSPGRPSPNRTSLSDQAQRGQRRLKREADVAYRDHPHDPPLDKVRPAESVPILCFRDRGRRGARINQFWLSGRAISGRVQPPPPATSSGGTTGLITSRVQAGIYASRSGTHAEITVAVDPPGGVTASFW